MKSAIGPGVHGCSGSCEGDMAARGVEELGAGLSRFDPGGVRAAQGD